MPKAGMARRHDVSALRVHRVHGKASIAVAEACSLSETAFYHWKKRYAGMEVAE
jgi:hypothetical protein